MITFLKRMLGLMPKAVMPDPALERCSTCFFPTEFHQVPLIGVKTYNYDTKIFTFGLPEDVSLDLPVCACLLVQGYDDAGEPAIRPYTPTSPNEQKGSFDLMVKIYEKGVVSQWLNNLQIGTLVGFKHIPFNIKAQYPFAGKKKVSRPTLLWPAFCKRARARMHTKGLTHQGLRPDQHDLRRDGHHTHVPGSAQNRQHAR